MQRREEVVEGWVLIERIGEGRLGSIENRSTDRTRLKGQDILTLCLAILERKRGSLPQLSTEAD